MCITPSGAFCFDRRSDNSVGRTRHSLMSYSLGFLFAVELAQQEAQNVFQHNAPPVERRLFRRFVANKYEGSRVCVVGPKIDTDRVSFLHWDGRPLTVAD